MQGDPQALKPPRARQPDGSPWTTRLIGP
jgi:hypothetical protein